MQVTIRAAIQNDAAELARLLRNIGWFKQMQGKSYPETVEQLSNQLTAVLADDSHSLFVAADPKHRLVGYIAAHWLPYLFMSGSEGFLSELFVNGSARGSGVGSKLLEKIELEAKARNCSRLQLINFRHQESYERRFYEKQGWEERPLAASFTKHI